MSCVNQRSVKIKYQILYFIHFLVPVVKVGYIAVNVNYLNVFSFVLTLHIFAYQRIIMQTPFIGIFPVAKTFHNQFLATSSIKTLAGLNAGIL